MEVFSEEWADAWCAALNASDTYRSAASAWEGAVVLAATDAAERAVHLDLHQGACRAARPATADDLAGARFVLAADPATWREVLAGRLAPLLGVMTGRIRLRQGKLLELMPYVAAAQAMVATAATLEATFPEDWPA